MAGPSSDCLACSRGHVCRHLSRQIAAFRNPVYGRRDFRCHGDYGDSRASFPMLHGSRRMHTAPRPGFRGPFDTTESRPHTRCRPFTAGSEGEIIVDKTYACLSHCIVRIHVSLLRQSGGSFPEARSPGYGFWSHSLQRCTQYGVIQTVSPDITHMIVCQADSKQTCRAPARRGAERLRSRPTRIRRGALEGNHKIHFACSRST